MTPEQLVLELVMVVEQTCYPRFDRLGNQEPVTNEQFDIVADKVMMLIKKHKTRPE